MIKFKDIKAEQGAIEILKQGQATEFWKLVVRALEDSKKFIEKEMRSENMLDLPAELYKLQNELFKAKLKFLDTLIETPDNIASWLERPSVERPKNFDPYDSSL